MATHDHDIYDSIDMEFHVPQSADTPQSPVVDVQSPEMIVSPSPSVHEYPPSEPEQAFVDTVHTRQRERGMTAWLRHMQEKQSNMTVLDRLKSLLHS